MAASYSSKSKARPAPNNFLEALRELGQDTISEAKIQVRKVVTDDVPQAFGLNGTLKANESVSVADLAHAEAKGEQNAESRLSGRVQQVREEERAFYQHLEAQNKQQIQSIQAEIRSLARAAGSLAHEVEIAAFQAPANPGVYHRNFFEQLHSLLKVLRQKVQDSEHWLATTNSRANKKSYYWGQVQKSGTSYMLSSERYMVTSTG